MATVIAMKTVGSLADAIDNLNLLCEREPFDKDLFNAVLNSESLKPLKLNDAQLKEIVSKLEQSFEEGLRSSKDDAPAVKMLPTYVRATSVGDERGNFLAIDIGGTKLRVLMITLEKERQNVCQETYQMTDELRTGSGIALFDYIADCVLKFMKVHQLTDPNRRMPLGFTLSFPCRQDGFASATLIRWTKGFKASGVEGHDVMQLLREALKRKGVNNVDVIAALNDTTGTMLACSFKEKHCRIGLVIGTGTNACYMEQLSAIPKLKNVINTKDGLPAEMCINTEWGGFGDDGKLDNILTRFDTKLDSQSINPKRQRFEKAISGMYLGELVRLVLEELARTDLLFLKSKSMAAKALSKRNCFSTALISEIENLVLSRTGNGPLAMIADRLLHQIGVSDASPTDSVIVAYVCSLISTRSAHLCACGLAALLKRMNNAFVVIGVDGAVYRLHPTYRHLLRNKIADLVDVNKLKFELVPSEDGSGRGAAVAAAIAKRMLEAVGEAKTNR